MKLFDFEITIDSKNQLSFYHSGYDRGEWLMAENYKLIWVDDVYLSFWLQYCTKLLFNFGFPFKKEGLLFFKLLRDLSDELEKDFQGEIARALEFSEVFMQELKKNPNSNEQSTEALLKASERVTIKQECDNWVYRLDENKKYKYSFAPDGKCRKIAWGSYVKTYNEDMPYAIKIKFPFFVESNAIMLSAIAIFEDFLLRKNLEKIFKESVRYFVKTCEMAAINGSFNLASIVEIPRDVTKNVMGKSDDADYDENENEDEKE